jgi:twitching motility protein PilT
MGTNLRVREAIALGEADGRSFYEIIESNSTFGWTTFDQSLSRAYEAGTITEDTADLYATSKARMTRYIDSVKKKRGIDDDKPTGLKLDLNAAVMPAGGLRMGA